MRPDEGLPLTARSVDTDAQSLLRARGVHPTAARRNTTLQAAGRAEVIGTRSAGGAPMIEAATPLSCGLQAWIPNRRPVHTSSGANWEGTGVVPDVEAADAVALPAAHLHLLRRLRAHVTDPERQAELDRIIADVAPRGPSRR